ncbi:gluconolactonase-like [Glandiceps talaboti]
MAAICVRLSIIALLIVSVEGAGICDTDPATNPFQSYTEEFADILGESPKLELLYESLNEPAEFHEGPVYFSDDLDGFLLYTNQPSADYTDPDTEPQIAIKRYDIASNTVSVFRNTSSANMPNGQTKDSNGHLLTCEQGFRSTPARITRTNIATGESEVIVDSYYGRLLNSLNDVVVKSDGTIWFTDPSYGYVQGFKDAPELGTFIYRYDPDGTDPKLTVVADDFKKPNGLVFSPDEKFLYVSDSGAVEGDGNYNVDFPHHIRRLEVHDGRYLRNNQLLAVTLECVNTAEGQLPGIPDGIKVDICGNLYVGSGDGVEVFTPDGLPMGKILLGRGAPNLVFGGEYGNELYMLADAALYRVKLNIQGVEFSGFTPEDGTSVELIKKDQCNTSNAALFQVNIATLVAFSFLNFLN